MAGTRTRTARKSRKPPSGKFVLRLSPELHAMLREAAHDAGLSLNDYCVRKLAAPVGDIAVHSDASVLVARAADLFADDLMAIVVYGSWARGEARAGSDVDVLIVVAPGVPVTRALYRKWDDLPPISWDGHVVDPHFIHPPDRDRGTRGSWAEAAIDGIVIFERGLQISRQLAGIRRDILAGRLVRRVLHGQPYWSEVA
jgi:predicted nucleotidyltransferase